MTSLEIPVRPKYPLRIRETTHINETMVINHPNHHICLSDIGLNSPSLCYLLISDCPHITTYNKDKKSRSRCISLCWCWMSCKKQQSTVILFILQYWNVALTSISAVIKENGRLRVLCEKLLQMRVSKSGFHQINQIHQTTKIKNTSR